MRFMVRSGALAFAFAAALTAGLIAGPGAAQAADADKPTYELGLYLWAASMVAEVDSEQFDSTSRISFSDVWDNLNLALMGRARANFGKASVVFDGNYMDLQSDRKQKTVNVGPGPGVDLTGSAKAQLEANIMELNTGYQVFNVKGPYSNGPNDTRSTRGELYVGGRYYAIKPSLTFRGPFGRRDLGEWDSWVDGVVGARVFVDLSKTVALGMQGDIGGFNIGNSSNLAWEQITSLSWNCTDSVTIALGYKFLDFRKEDGDNSLDVQIRGPFIASFYRF
jgi:opacity protein-like surface antigen